MVNHTARWVLAFDGSCGSCRGIAEAVAKACSDKIQVLPLRHPDVAKWREESFGPDAAWKPTLLMVGSGRVRAWTGVRLATRLGRLLGPATSVRVVRALGQLRMEARRGEVGGPTIDVSRPGTSRRRFLQQVGFGALTVAGMMASGSAPAFADTVAAWAKANEDAMPTTLTDLSRLPVAYRRVAYAAMTPNQRSRAWVEHLDSYAAQHPGLSREQHAVLAEARALASKVSTFGPAVDDHKITAIGDRVKASFGEQAGSVIATLGPKEAEPDTNTPAASACTCSVASDYCNNSTTCHQNMYNCVRTGGCGSFYFYECDGLCAP
jgi:hypothetical protein